MNTEILIVEDEGLIALDLQKRLERVGYTVPAIVDNADDALLTVERLRPSLVLMDIRLRGPRDGVEAADQIRRRYHLPVIFVTAHADRETLDRARVTEPFGYIVKPFQSVDFRAQIEMALWKHKMEQKLRVSEAWFSATFQNVADALIATDREGNVTFMNKPAAALTGWEWQEAKGRPLTEVFGARDELTGLPAAEPLDEIYNSHHPGQGPRTFKLTRRGHADSVLVEAEVSANRDQGTLFGIIVVFRDVTARRTAERQDRQLQKMSALALMATGLGRELAESQSRMDESLKHLIEQSRGATLRLLWDAYERSAHQQSVVQQLITLGRTDAGQAVVVDLNDTLSGMEDKIRKSLGTRRQLSLTLEHGIPSIQTDPRFLRENLLRLVADARQSTPDGGLVEISTTALRSPDGKQVAQIKIRDSRKTLRTDTQERLFDPYYQSRPGNKNSGFSLSLVYQFVALSGGCIDVETSPGEGSAYLLRFPAVGVPHLSAQEQDGENSTTPFHAAFAANSSDVAGSRAS